MGRGGGGYYQRVIEGGNYKERNVGRERHKKIKENCWVIPGDLTLLIPKYS